MPFFVNINTLVRSKTAFFTMFSVSGAHLYFSLSFARCTTADFDNPANDDTFGRIFIYTMTPLIVYFEMQLSSN